MTTEELNAALAIAKKIKRLQAQLDDIHITGSPGSTGGNSPVQGGSKSSSAMIAAEISSDIDGLKRELEIEQAVIKRGLDKVADMDDTERRLMSLRYVDCRPWKVIGILLGYTERQIYRIHVAALNKSVNVT